MEDEKMFEEYSFQFLKLNDSVLFAQKIIIPLMPEKRWDMRGYIRIFFAW